MPRKIVLLSLLLLIIIPFTTINQGNNPEEYPDELESGIFLPASNPVIWHDNCNDTSSFPDLADAWYTGAMGSIASENGYIYPTDFGSSSGIHGPVYYHTFQPAFTIGMLDYLEVEIELDGSSAIGATAIMLFDSDYKRIVLLDVADSWTGQDDTAAYAGWTTADLTSTFTPRSWPSDTVSEPYHETLRLEINGTGVYGLIPRVGDFKMLNLGDIDFEREIAYLCVQFRHPDSYTPCQTMRIHDIQMQYTDRTIPTINHPSDIEYIFGDPGSSITWMPLDDYPSSYQIYKDGTEILGRDWNSTSEEITISVDGLDAGVYNYTITVSDISGNVVSDEVTVTVSEPNTTPTTPTAASTPPPDNPLITGMLIGLAVGAGLVIIVVILFLKKR